MWRRQVDRLLSRVGSRCFAQKTSTRSVLLQDVESMQVHKFKQKNPKEHRVYVYGLAETGALGVNKSLKKHSQVQAAFVQHPTRLPFAEKYDVLDVACGYGFSLFVVKRTDEGITLFGTGINTDSQIGYHKHSGETNNPIDLIIYPVPIELPKRTSTEEIVIEKCAAGRAHCLALSSAGAVYSIGNNAYGQCGRPIIEDEKYSGSALIHRINSLDNLRIKDISCGQDHSLFLTKDGKLYSCGWGADGQTGLGHYQIEHKPSLIEGDLKTENVVKVSSVGDCVLALNDKGDVFGWGNAEYGQFEVFNDVQQINSPQYLKMAKECGRIVDIAAGGSFCAILNDEGDVFIWGYGILGLGPAVDEIAKPQKIPSTLFGRNDFNPECRVISVHCGLNHLGAINSQGDLFMWGKNKFGCLGLGHINDQFFPFKVAISAKVKKISCGVDHTLALCKPFV